jgi:hypothetical protein
MARLVIFSSGSIVPRRAPGVRRCNDVDPGWSEKSGRGVLGQPRPHKHLKITESEWAAFCKDFDDTMAKFNVPEAEHKELFAIVESTKGDIVTPSSSV